MLCAWLKHNGLWISSSTRDDAQTQAQAQARTVTHVFLDGGKASVGPAHREAFHLACAADLVAGRPLYVVERTIRGGSYRMFADFDVPLSLLRLPPDADGGAELIGARLMAAVRRALELAPPQLRVGEVVVCTRRAHEGKTGAHLTWQDDRARVDDRTATALRALWIDALILRQLDAEGAEGPEGPEGGSAIEWDRVIDASVYRRNGLRMPWSLKKRGASAAAAYAPTHVAAYSEGAFAGVRAIEGDGVGQSAAAWLARCSIDADARAPTLVLLDAAGGVAAASAKKKQGKRRSNATRTDEEEDEDEEGANAEVGPTVALSAIERAALEAALPSELYGDCELGHRCIRIGPTGPTQHKAGGGGGLTVSSTSRYCQAAGREHTSNHVYFDFLLPGTVVQRCHACVHARVRTAPESAGAMAAAVPVIRRVATSGSSKRKRPVPSLLPAQSAAGAAGFWLARVR